LSEEGRKGETGKELLRTEGEWVSRTRKVAGEFGERGQPYLVRGER